MSKPWRRLLATVVVLVAIASALPFVVGWQVSSTLLYPPPFDNPDSPARYGLKPENVNIQSPRVAAPLKGWLFKNPASRDRAVLFLHGWRSHRQHMLKNYLSWLAKHYTVLAFDHPNHGESPKGVTTLGDGETTDAAAALAVLRERGYRHVAVMGTSMGGTTAIDLAAADPGVAGVVSEATYAKPSNITLGFFAKHGYWFPVLLIHGTADSVILPENAQVLYQAAREPKQLWMVPGADHMSEADRCPHAIAPREYEKRVTTFLDHALSVPEHILGVRG
jgi:pimeloyl-ACP methyl ester carboxylesterase